MFDIALDNKSAKMQVVNFADILTAFIFAKLVPRSRTNVAIKCCIIAREPRRQSLLVEQLTLAPQMLHFRRRFWNLKIPALQRCFLRIPGSVNLGHRFEKKSVGGDLYIFIFLLLTSLPPFTYCLLISREHAQN